MKNREKLRKYSLKTDTDTEDIEYVKRKHSNPEIEDCSHCPVWQLRKLNNEFLYDGYRVNYRTYSDLFKSVWDIHNETCNIWTHLIGAFIFLGLIYYNYLNFFDPIKIKEQVLADKIDSFPDEISADFMSERLPVLINSTLEYYKPDASDNGIGAQVWTNMVMIGELKMDFGPQISQFASFYEKINFATVVNNDLNLIPFFLFLCSPVICFIFSAIMHTFWIKSRRASRFFLRMDYSGIAILIFGSITSGIYYAIPCLDSRFYFIYTTGFFSFVTLLSINLNLLRKTPKSFKAGVFITQGCVAIFPIIHWIYST